MYEAKIERDSISPDDVRLTTFLVTFPRIILAEVNTHRVFSRNSASSRAIPVEKRIAMVKLDPFIPEQFGKNQKGMQAGDPLEAAHAKEAEEAWRVGLDHAIRCAKWLAEIGVHKQLANRLLEPFAWHPCLITATEWENWWNLRCNKNAQPEIQKIAGMMRELYTAGKPTELKYGEWHLPFVNLEEPGVSLSPEDGESFNAKMVSAGRCARLSYMTHEGIRAPVKDVELAQSLLKNVHMSPFEHVARPMNPSERDIVFSTGSMKDRGMPFCGNFKGWIQMRKEIPGESVWKETEE